MKEILIYKATVKSRGWTEKLIEKFLKEPDKLVSNPNYRSGPKAKLYKLKRIEEFESIEEVKTSIQKSILSRNKRKEKTYNKNQEIQNKIITIVNSKLEYDIAIVNSKITIHCGPTNSGKTYTALQDLKTSSNGLFLSPLRLLAWEVYYRFNKEGICTSLITGEEKIIVPTATIDSCTVEMFNPSKVYDCVILDEAHMIDDNNRGWAWLRTILLCKSNKLHLIISQEALYLIKTILDRLGKIYEIKNYERLVPLKIANNIYNIDKPLDKTIFVIFSRLEVLEFKKHFEKIGKSVSIIYGNLPPEIRKRQIERFINGETQICVATDAIGMGMNLPADRVCFIKTSKFDGFEVRKLNALEVKQIAGRAGRFQLSEFGEVGALDNENLIFINNCLNSEIIQKKFARIAPELDELMQFNEKKLFDKLFKWKNINTIPDNFKDILLQTDLDDQLELAKYFDEESQNIIGIENVFKLIKAPVKKNNCFWISCIYSILREDYLPIPDPNFNINEYNLLEAEQEVNNCEVYNWIYNCTNFRSLCNDFEKVKDIKDKLINIIDNFLITKKKNKKNSYSQ